MTPVALAKADAVVLRAGRTATSTSGRVGLNVVVPGSHLAAELDAENVTLVVLLIPLAELNNAKTMEVELIAVVLNDVVEAHAGGLGGPIDHKLHLSAVGQIIGDLSLNVVPPVLLKLSSRLLVDA